MGQKSYTSKKNSAGCLLTNACCRKAADKSNPLIERMRFLGFTPTTRMSFKVRFAELKRRIIISEEQGSTAHSRHLLGKDSAPRSEGRSGIR